MAPIANPSHYAGTNRKVLAWRGMTPGRASSSGDVEEATSNNDGTSIRGQLSAMSVYNKIHPPASSQMPAGSTIIDHPFPVVLQQSTHHSKQLHFFNYSTIQCRRGGMMQRKAGESFPLRGTHDAEPAVSGLGNLTKAVVGSNSTHPTFCQKIPEIHSSSKMYSSQDV